MQRTISADEHSGLKAPKPNPPAVIAIAYLWLIFACVLPVHQLCEVRRQARQDLLHIHAADNPDKTRATVALGRFNQNHDAMACGRCLILAFTSIFLVHQLLKFNQRCNALATDLPVPNHRGRGPDEASAK